VLTLNDIVIY